MGSDYKKLLNKNKKKKFADPKNMGVNIDKNEYYEIILSNSAHPENILFSCKKKIFNLQKFLKQMTWQLSFFEVNYLYALQSNWQKNMGMWYSAEQKLTKCQVLWEAVDTPQSEGLIDN